MVYSGDPSSTPTDAIRFWLGDTGNAPLLSDPEILYMITATQADAGGDPLLVASHCCRAICAKYAGEVAISGDGVTYSGEQLQTKYSQLAVDLRAEYERQVNSQALPLAGVASDCSTQPMFGIGQHDNPYAGSQRFVPNGADYYIDPANLPPG